MKADRLHILSGHQISLPHTASHRPSYGQQTGHFNRSVNFSDTLHSAAVTDRYTSSVEAKWHICGNVDEIIN